MLESTANLGVTSSHNFDRSWSIDSDMNITIINDRMLNDYFIAFGEKLEKGENILSGLDDNLYAIWKKRYERALAGEQFIELDSFNIKGIPEITQTSFTPIIFNDKVVGVSCFSSNVSELKKVEFNLKKSEANVRALIEHSRSSIWSVDQNYRLIKTNSHFIKNFQTIFSSSIKSDSILIDLLSEPFKSQMKERIDRAFQGETFSIIEDKFDFGTTYPQYIEISYTPIIIDGSVIGVSCFANNISEFKRVELALKKSEANLRTLIESNNTSIWSVDRNYRLIATNSRYKSTFDVNFSCSLQSGDVLIDLLPEPYKSQVKGWIDRALAGEHYSVIENTNLGNVLYVDVSFTPIEIDGEIVGVACFSRDISEFKRVELALKKSEANLRSLIEVKNASIWSVDREHRLIATNSRFKAWFDTNFSCSIEPGSPISSMVPEPYESIMKGRLNRCLSGETFTIIDHYDFGTTRYVEASFNPIEIDGQIEGVACYSRDISELKASEQKLLEINASKDQFFSILAHDLKGPLRNIKALTQLLKQGVSCTDEEREEIISLIDNSTNSTYDLLENLLTWSLSQSNGLEVKPRNMLVYELVDETLLSLEQMAKDKGVLLLKEIDSDIGVFADHDMISLVIRNLVTNGIKFTEKGDYVKISASYTKEDKQVCISVSDNGIGMNEQILKNLFQIGGKYSRPGTANEQGTGFGMIIIKDFVEKNNGTLSVQSEVNKGSTFSFELRSVTVEK